MVGGGLDDLFEQVERAARRRRGGWRAARRGGTPARAPRVSDGEADARAEQALEVAPALARRVVTVQRPVRAQIRRVELQHLLVGRERVVLVVQRRLVELGDLRQQVQPLAHVQLRELARVEQRAQLAPALAVAVEPRQRAERARVQRLGLEDLRVDLLRVLARARAASPAAPRPPPADRGAGSGPRSRPTPRAASRPARRSCPPRSAKPSSASRFFASAGSMSNSARLAR